MAQAFRAVRRDCALADESRAGMVSVGRGARFCNGYSLTKSCLEGRSGAAGCPGNVYNALPGADGQAVAQETFHGPADCQE